MSKTILVTGATGAFGSLICIGLVKLGHKVIGTTRSYSKKQEVVHQLEAAGVKVVEMDVTSTDSVDTAVLDVLKKVGHIDVLFHNAGIGSFGIQELFTVEEMKRVFDINVLGVQRVMRAVLPHMRARGKGTVLYTSSLIGRIVTPFYGTYSASKWALEAIAESYRAELSGFGIDFVYY